MRTCGATTTIASTRCATSASSPARIASRSSAAMFDGQLVARIARSGLDRLHALRRTVVPGLRRQHADQSRPLRRQRARRLVGPVAELLDGAEHAVPGAGAQVGRVVERPRHGLVRDAGEARDIPDVRGALGVGHVPSVTDHTGGSLQRRERPHRERAEPLDRRRRCGEPRAARRQRPRLVRCSTTCTPAASSTRVRGPLAAGLGVVDVERVDADEHRPARSGMRRLRVEERRAVAVLGRAEVPVPAGVQQHGRAAHVAVARRRSRHAMPRPMGAVRP